MRRGANSAGNDANKRSAGLTRLESKYRQIAAPGNASTARRAGKRHAGFPSLLIRPLDYRHRLSVKPGVTGWAQVNHKYGDTIEDTIIKLEYDLYYIKYLAPSLDAFILFHTVKTVLLGRGAQ